MRKRQVKKFAKAAKQNMDPYRTAYSGAGSKKLLRRRRSFGRYNKNGNTWVDLSERARRKTALLSKFILETQQLDCCRSAYERLTRITEQTVGSFVTSLQAMLAGCEAAELRVEI